MTSIGIYHRALAHGIKWIATAFGAVGALSVNVLDRRFEAPPPNSKWMADFTYIWTAEGWLYVAAVIDLFSRRVVGWSMSAAITAVRHGRAGDGNLAARAPERAAA